MVYRHPHARAVPVSVVVEAWIVVASIVVSIFLIETEVIHSLIQLLGQSYALSSFIAGIFFTSILTTTPAVVALGEISVHAPIWQVAFFGALGSLTGDLLIFRFIRSRLVLYIMRGFINQRTLRYGKRLAAGPLWWVPIIGGGLIIASPLPDEIGLVMLGMSEIKTWQFIPISFFANAFGIAMIALVVQHLTI